MAIKIACTGAVCGLEVRATFYHFLNIKFE